MRKLSVLTPAVWVLALVAVLIGGVQRAAAAGESNAGEQSYVDASLFLLGAGLTGTIEVGGATADVDVSFSDILKNLEFGAMGSVRVQRKRWGFATEVMFTGLGASKGQFSADMDQWLVEPRVTYRMSPHFEPLLGARYNSLSGEIRGPFGRNSTGTQDWIDPIVGATVTLPLGRKLDLVGHGDIGGFGVGSDFTWQAFPYLNWKLGKSASVQAGYRFLDVDYETGSGPTLFHYDVLTEGPQGGITLRFGGK